MTRKHQPTDPSPRPFHDSNRPTAEASTLSPVVRAADDVPSSDPLAELLWRHRMFGDWDDDDLTCGCGATPPEDACEERFGNDRWHDEHLAAAITQALAQDGEQAARDRAAAPSRAAVNAMARVLIAEWERVEAPVTPSYIATFADLARAALTYTTASERSGK